MIATIHATLNNIYKGNDFRDKSTGEIIEGKNYIQIMVDTPQPNGEVRKELLNVSIPEGRVDDYKSKVGKNIDILCNISSKGSLYVNAQ